MKEFHNKMKSFDKAIFKAKREMNLKKEKSKAKKSSKK